MPNPYDILDLRINCSDKEIKQAYKMAAKKHHPDKGGNPKQFALITLAYDTLKDKDKRQKFDESGFMDGDSAMEKTEKASQLLQQLFFSILENSNHDFIESLDLIGSLKANINKKISELEAFIENLKQAEIKQKKALKVLKKRLKRAADKSNILLNALEASVTGIPNQIIFIKCQIDIQKEMYNLAAEYCYDFEKSSAPTNNSWGFSAGSHSNFKF